MEKIMSVLVPHHHHTPHHSTPQSSVSVCTDPLAATGMDIFSPSPDLLSPQHPYPTHSTFPSFSAPSFAAHQGPSCASPAMPPPPPSPTRQKLKPPHVVIEHHKHQLFPGSIGRVAIKLTLSLVPVPFPLQILEQRLHPLTRDQEMMKTLTTTLVGISIRTLCTHPLYPCNT